MVRFVSATLALMIVCGVGNGQGTRKSPVVVLDTSHGKITIELNEEKAPVTVKNFLQYVDEKFYDGKIFHRVIADFMIQGGGFDVDLKEMQTRAPIKNESTNGLSNKRGTIAMARIDDPDSATAQFYINVVDNPNLDGSQDKPGYAVFGRVIAGMDAVDRIRVVATGERDGHDDVPLQPILIRSARRAK